MLSSREGLTLGCANVFKLVFPNAPVVDDRGVVSWMGEDNSYRHQRYFFRSEDPPFYIMVCLIGAELYGLPARVTIEDIKRVVLPLELLQLDHQCLAHEDAPSGVAEMILNGKKTQALKVEHTVAFLDYPGRKSRVSQGRKRARNSEKVVLFGNCYQLLFPVVDNRIASVELQTLSVPVPGYEISEPALISFPDMDELNRCRGHPEVDPPAFFQGLMVRI